ncbi:hypothetical protein C8Q74DRAFT_1241572, partial [Fomes fomentarius]
MSKVRTSTSIPSVCPPYTLSSSFSIKPASEAPGTGPLFSGTYSTLHIANLTFEPTGQLYTLGYSLLPDTYTDPSIYATRDYTYAIMNGDESNPRYQHTLMDIWGDYDAWKHV